MAIARAIKTRYTRYTSVFLMGKEHPSTVDFRLSVNGNSWEQDSVPEKPDVPDNREI